jgi:AhpC/TSA family
MRRSQFLIISFSLIALCATVPIQSFAQVDFFGTPEQKNQPTSRLCQPANTNRRKARVIFFLAPGCLSCPEEASRVQRELSRSGWQYEIEGIFVGDPPQVGKYLSELRGYPFNFAIGLDMDGKIARQYGVKMFPSAIIEVAGKRTVVTRASEVEDKLK